MAQKTYKILRHSDKGYETVKVGFCWPAFFFAFWWALVKGLWLIALLFLATFLVSRITIHEVDRSDQLGWSLAFLAVGLVCRYLLGRHGNSLRVSKLQRRGYQTVANVTARSGTQAFQAWKDQNPREFVTSNPERPYRARHVKNPTLEYRYTLDEIKDTYERGVIGDTWEAMKDGETDWIPIQQLLAATSPQAQGDKKGA